MIITSNLKHINQVLINGEQHSSYSNIIPIK